jgi:predicted KAP-like P-loop ATPase
MPRKNRVPHIAPTSSDVTEPFASDSPLSDPQLDRFRRLPFAERIANTLAQRRDPDSTVILINGRWGEGKTTLLRYAYGTLQKFDNVVPVWFNPWRFSDETSLLLSFFATIAGALDKSSKTKKEKVGDLIRDYGAVVGEVAVEAYGVKLSAGKAVSKLGEQLSSVSLEEKREHIAAMLGKSGKRVVAFLDDIDRLSRVEAQAVFKLLKLTANFEHVSYVLAFDRDVVAAAIGQQFGQGDRQAGYDYLEKIVQVNLDLPVADRDALAQLCIDGVNAALRTASISLTPEQSQEFQLAFLQYIVPALNTPRLAKLYANSVAFVLPLLAREVNPVDLLILEAIRFLYPLLHQDIRTTPQVYTGEFGWDLSNLLDRDAGSKEHLARLLEKAVGPDTKRAQSLLGDLFPQLRQLFRSGRYGDRNHERVQREQRVSSLDYLWRYLTCSIPTGHISDEDVNRFLQAIATLSEDEIGARYRKLIRPDEQTKLLSKLRRRSEDLPSESAKKLAMVVAKHGSDIQETPDAIVQPIALAGFLIRELISRVEQTHRYDVAADVLRAAEPVFFAVVCLDWLRPQRAEISDDLLFSPADVDKLTSTVADKIAVHAARNSILSQSSEETARLLTVWQQGQGSLRVKDHIKGALAAEPTAANQFIRPFSSFPRTGTSGMDQVGYHFLLKFVDPDVLMAAFETSGLLDPVRTDDTARIAQQFAAIHRSEQAAQAGAQNVALESIDPPSGGAAGDAP